MSFGHHETCGICHTSGPCEHSDFDLNIPEDNEVDDYSTREGMSWDVDGMTILIKDHGEVVMKIFLGEAIEGSHRFLVESHIKEIDRSPWIKHWHGLDEWNRESI
jgi:hypothetical protein